MSLISAASGDRIIYGQTTQAGCSLGSNGVNSDAVTIACWLYVPTTWPAGGQYAMSISDNHNTTSDYSDLLCWYLSGGNTGTIRGLHNNSSASGVEWSSADHTGADVDVWIPFIMVVNESSRLSYIGTTAQASSTESTSVVWNQLLTTFRVGQANGNTASGGMVGRWAEVSVWNKNLSVSEAEQYCGGTSADQISPANLMGYWFKQGQNNGNDNSGNGWDLDTETGAGSLSYDTGTGGSAHPTITYANKGRMLLMGVG